MRVHVEPARLLRLDGRCEASAESHARLCGRLASCHDAAVARDNRAAAASQPSLIAAVATLMAVVLSMHVHLEPARLILDSATSQQLAKRPQSLAWLSAEA